MSKQKLTIDQRIKKAALYETYSKQVKGKTRNEIKKHWQGYRREKYVIIELPKYKERYKKAAPEKRIELRSNYFERKKIAEKKAIFGELYQTKTNQWKSYNQKYYSLIHGENLKKTDSKINNIVGKLFDSKDEPEHILVTCRIELPSGQRVYISKVFNKELYDRLNAKGVSMIDAISQDSALVDNYKGYKIKKTFIRTVYKR